jgi:hypothetical protein
MASPFPKLFPRITAWLISLNRSTLAKAVTYGRRLLGVTSGRDGTHKVWNTHCREFSLCVIDDSAQVVDFLCPLFFSSFSIRRGTGQGYRCNRSEDLRSQWQDSQPEQPEKKSQTLFTKEIQGRNSPCRSNTFIAPKTPCLTTHSPNHRRYPRQPRRRSRPPTIPPPTRSYHPRWPQFIQAPDHRKCHQVRLTKHLYSPSRTRPQLQEAGPQSRTERQQLLGADRPAHQQRRCHGGTVFYHGRWTGVSVRN